MKPTLFINIIDGKVISIHSTQDIDDDNIQVFVANHIDKTATQEYVHPVSDGTMIEMLSNLQLTK